MMRLNVWLLIQYLILKQDSMEILRNEYRKSDKSKFIFNKGTKIKPFKNKDLFIRERNNELILKIRTKRKYPFKRIIFKNLIENKLWFGKYENDENLFFIKKIGKRILFFVFIDQRKYEILLVDLIRLNPSILYNKIV